MVPSCTVVARRCVAEDFEKMCWKLVQVQYDSKWMKSCIAPRRWSIETSRPGPIRKPLGSAIQNRSYFLFSWKKNFTMSVFIYGRGKKNHVVSMVRMVRMHGPEGFQMGKLFVLPLNTLTSTHIKYQVMNRSFTRQNVRLSYCTDDHITLSHL